MKWLTAVVVVQLVASAIAPFVGVRAACALAAGAWVTLLAAGVVTVVGRALQGEKFVW